MITGDTVRQPARLADIGVTFELNEPWRCDCTKEHRFGPYVAAHWSAAIDHTCDCGRQRTFIAGRVTRNRRSEPRK